jgi:hypothetical protein
MTLTYKQFNDDFFIVLCNDKKKYGDFFEPIGAKIHKDGFLINKDKIIQLEKIISFINIHENAKSRKEQTRFRREYSESDDTDDDDDDDETSPEISKKDNRAKYKKSDPKMYKKSFISRPVDFKKVDRENYSDDDDYSSSSYHSSSSDGFPSPSTPGRRYSNSEIEELRGEINNMRERIKYLENK